MDRFSRWILLVALVSACSGSKGGGPSQAGEDASVGVDAQGDIPADGSVPSTDAGSPDAACVSRPCSGCGVGEDGCGGRLDCGPCDCRFTAELVTAPEGYRLASARDLNEEGAVLVQAYDAQDRAEPYIRRADGTFVMIGVPAGASGRSASAFNDLEQVTGYYYGPDVSGPSIGYIWTAGVTYDLSVPDLGNRTRCCDCPQPPGRRVNTLGEGLNNRGEVVGVAYDGASGVNAMRWVGGCAEFLPQPSRSTWPAHITESRYIAGSFTSDEMRQTGPGSSQIYSGGVLWQGDGYRLFVAPDGDLYLHDVNERGEVVLGIAPYVDPQRSYGPTIAEVRDAEGGVLRRLRALPSLPSATATSLNDQGIASGSVWKCSGWMETEICERRAVYWRHSEPVEINGHVEPATPLLIDAMKINNAGRILAMAEDGRFYLLTPAGDCFDR